MRSSFHESEWMVRWVIGLYLLFSCVVCAQTQTNVAPLRIVTVVIDDDYPPYSFRDAAGTLQGIVPDAWRTWTKHTQISVNLIGMEWEKALQFMKEGEADVIDTIFYTEDRKQLFDFSQPYTQIEAPIFVQKDVAGITNLASLRNVTIGVKAGDAVIEVLKSHSLTNLMKYNSYASVIQAAVNRQLQVFSVDMPPARYYFQKFHLQNEFRYPIVLYTGAFHRAVTKGNLSLLQTVEDGFARSKRECRAIESHWLGEGLVRPTYVRLLKFVALGIALLALVLGVFNVVLQRKVRTKTAKLNELVRQLTRSEEKYRTLVENISAGVYRVAVEDGGRFLQVNPALVKMLGYESADELMNVPAEQIYLDPTDGWHALKKIRETGAYKNEEVRARKKDGSSLWVSRSTQAIFNEQDKLLWLDGIVVDITEHKQAEEVLRANGDKLKSIFRAAPVGIGMAVNNTIHEANEYLSDMIGYSQDELQGQPICILFPTEEELDSADKEKYRQIEEKGIGVLETHWRKKSGEVIAILLSAAPIDPSNLSLGVTFAALDISDRKRAEEELRDSHAYLQAVFDSIDDALFVNDANTFQIIDVNRRSCEMYGYSYEEALKKTIGDLSFGSPPYSLNDAMEWMRKARDDGPQTFEWLARHHTGRTFWVEMSIRYALIGQHERFLVVIRDITERKREVEDRLKYERQIQYAQKLESLGLLAGGIAHDFNNLLTVILGNMNLALSQLPAAEPAREHIQEAEKAIHRAADLSMQMLAYSGKGRFVVQPLDLREIVKDMEGILLSVVSKKALLQLKSEERVPLIQGDATQIRQVIMNLAINASEALGNRSGKIVVTVGAKECPPNSGAITRNNKSLPKGLYAYVEVFDNGSGIEEKYLVKIFDPFFSTKFTGRGLGLAVVMGVADGHKGGIEVLSHPGKGTTIRVLFPSMKQPAQKLEKMECPSYWKGHGVVLLVDDEENVRSTAKKMLEHMGFQVLTASDGYQALEVYRVHSDEILCILLDLTMPRMDGQEALAELQHIQPDVRVVICSGYSKEEVVIRFKDRTVSGFLQKPYSLDSMRDILRPISESFDAEVRDRKQKMK